MEQERQLGEKIVLAALADQSYANAHAWKQTRYAGVFFIKQPSLRAVQKQFYRKRTSLNAQTAPGKSLVIEVGPSPLK